MTHKRTPLTWDQHLILGQELHDLGARMQEIACALGPSYGYRSKAYRRATTVVRAIMQLRSELDNRVYAEQAHRPDMELTRVYYPGPRMEHRP